MLLENKTQKLSAQKLIEKIKSSYAKKKDLNIKPYREEQANRLQSCYLKLASEISKRFNHSSLKKTLLQLTMRSSVINRPDRITGDGVIYVTDRLLKDKKRISSDEFHKILEDIVHYQVLVPEHSRNKPAISLDKKTTIARKIKSHLRIIQNNRESC